MVVLLAAGTFQLLWEGPNGRRTRYTGSSHFDFFDYVQRPMATPRQGKVTEVAAGTLRLTGMTHRQTRRIPSQRLSNKTTKQGSTISLLSQRPISSVRRGRMNQRDSFSRDKALTNEVDDGGKDRPFAFFCSSPMKTGYWSNIWMGRIPHSSNMSQALRAASRIE